MLIGVESEGFSPDLPTGKAPCQLLDVLFGVVAFPETEQFHQLACVVFVRMRLAIRRGVQVQEHRGVFGDRMD